MTPSPQDELQNRILRLLDGDMQPLEADALDQELRACRASRALYLQLATLHSSLESQFSSRSEIETGRIIPIDRFLSRQRRRIVQIAALSAAAVLTLTAVPLWLNLAQNHQALASFQTTPDASYQLSHSNNADNKSGQILHPGSRLKLQTGRLEAKFSSGIRCVVDAPCELIAISDSHMQITHGLAWFHVPPQAHGFKIETPRLRIIDLGTEFGVVAGNNGQDEIHVTKGSVEASHRIAGKTGKPHVLLAGQARAVTSTGDLIQTDLSASLFPTQLFQPLAIRNANFDSLEKISPDNDQRGYGHIPDWAASGAGVGLSSLDQPFLNQTPHSGTHAAFIQGKGLISQSVSGFDPTKQYTVTYFVSERGLPGASTRTAVSLDLGSTFYREPEPIRKTDTFRRIVSGPLHVFGPTANIEIRGQTASGDAALLIDSVSISRAVPCITDGGFESPVQVANGLNQALQPNKDSIAGSPWIFADGAGISNTFQDPSPPAAPEGSQAAFLEGIDSSIQTTIAGFERGVAYRLKLSAHSETLHSIPFQISLGPTTLSLSPVASDNIQQAVFKTFTSGNFSTNEENLLLLIRSTSPERILIDDLHFEFIAEANEP